MRALKLVGKDLQLGQNGYAEVQGVPKVRQDLVCAILTPYGSDRFHPQWGSVLNDRIGLPNTSLATQVIANEVKRVIGNLITAQTSTLRRYQANGLKSPYTNDDMIASVQNIQVLSAYNATSVSATVTTASSSSILLNAQGGPSGLVGVTSQ